MAGSPGPRGSPGASGGAVVGVFCICRTSGSRVALRAVQGMLCVGAAGAPECLLSGWWMDDHAFPVRAGQAGAAGLARHPTPSRPRGLPSTPGLAHPLLLTPIPSASPFRSIN